MKLKIISKTGTAGKEIELPKQFSEKIRVDLIKKVFLVFKSHNLQKYGAKPRAGLRASAYLSKRRNSYRSTYGIGQSRTPRKIMSSRGTRINYTGAVAPQTVSGRKAHPPKAEKILELKVNKKERRKAIRSAMSATLDKSILAEKFYEVPENYPFIIENGFEEIKKTKELKDILKKLNIEFSTERKIRAGKGKLRGRKYTRKKGPLFVVSKESNLLNAAKNMNIEVVEVNNLNIDNLAPGGQPGRVAFFTEEAISKLDKEKLFLNVKKIETKKVK